MTDASLSANSRTAFGSLLRKYRLARGLSQEALAERAKISTEAVSALERGARKAPQAQTLGLLMDALELDAAARVTFEGSITRPIRLPGLGEAAHATTVIASPRHNLPRRLSSFVNRVAETRELTALLTEYPLITVLGAGGVGKTRMALQLGELLRDRFSDGVWFVEFARLTDPSLVCAEIAAALDVRESPEVSILEVLIAALRQRRSLLIFDNCEHVIDAVAQISEAILQNSRGCTVLATSREPLRISGEHVYRLSTFDVPAAGSVVDAAVAMQFSAVALFMERSIAHEPSFALTDQNATTIATLCRRLDGIPLALELAAAKIPVLSAMQITERLDRRLTLLASGTRTTQPRQQTLRALIDWSFDLLSTAEQTLFGRVAIFGGSWTVDAASDICAGGLIDGSDVLDPLASLVAKSLVQSDANATGGTRFWFYETTREYAAEQLTRSGERDELTRKHAAYVLRFARAATVQRRELREKVWLDLVARHLDDIRGALSWSLGAGNDIALGAEIASALGFFWFSRRYGEGVDWLAKARERIDELEPAIAAHVYLESARIEPYGEHTLDLAKRAVSAYEVIGDTASLPESLALVGQNFVNQGQFESAQLILERGVLLAQQSGDDATRAKLLGLLGFSHIYARDFGPARNYFSTAVELARSIGRDHDHAIALRGFAELALWEGEAARAALLCTDAVDLLEAIGDDRGAAAARCHLAQCHFAAGQLALARGTVLGAIEQLTPMHLRLVFLHAITVLCAIYAAEHADRRAALLIGYVEARAGLLPYRQLVSAQRLFELTKAAITDRLTAAAAGFFADGAQLDDEALQALIAEGEQA